MTSLNTQSFHHRSRARSVGDPNRCLPKRCVSIFSYLLITVFSLSATTSIAMESIDVNEAKRPNVLLVVADDLGTFDIGAFGSEIRTPNIDKLANQGLQFTDFHTSATCSPTRAMLLTGADSHSAGLGNMIEHLAPNQRGEAGYEGRLSDRTITVASKLKDSGYRTYMAGKWHLGMDKEHLPAEKGFDQSFALLQGGASYFNDMMGLTGVAPNAEYRRNHQRVTELPDDFYATEYYADFIIDQLENDKKSDEPFFAYLAFSAPHWPLQVKDEHVDLYKGRYNSGYEKVLVERIKNAIELGVLPADIASGSFPSHVSKWEDLTEEQQKTQIRTMEIYASVVERMDFHLGRVLSYLESIGELENTMVVFLSDNGADGSDRSKLPGNDVWLPEAWDLSYENMGKKGSYVYPGAAWAKVSVGPYFMYKEFLSEGGIKSPMIISLPSGYKSVEKGSVINSFVSVKDITPTILEFTRTLNNFPVTPDNEQNEEPRASLEGQSLIPLITENNAAIKIQSVGWELFGQRAIRDGDWKLLWLSSKPKWLVTPNDADQWLLFNLEDDPAETNNLAAEEPEKLRDMIGLWKLYEEEHAVILPVW